MENDKKPITDQAFRYLAELKEKIQYITGPDKSVSLESLKESLTSLRDECRALEFEEQVDVLEGLESVVDSMINNKMTESAELFDLIISGVDHTEKVLQIKGVMKKDLSKNLKATMQNLPDDFSLFGKNKEKKSEGKSKSQDSEKDSDDNIVNFATGKKAKKVTSKQDPDSEPEEEVTDSKTAEVKKAANKEQASKVKKPVAEVKKEVKDEEEVKAEKPVKNVNKKEEAIVKAEKPVEEVRPEVKEEEEAKVETKVTEKQMEDANQEAEVVTTEPESPKEKISKEEEKVSVETTQVEKAEPVTENSKNPEAIRLTELNIQSIEETKRLIDEQIASKDSVEVIAENINTIDLSYLQLILSVRKTESKKHVSFEFEGSVGENLKFLLNNTGFPGIV